jgi:2,4-dienoyl-CoA reductase-like NADH-dependent reductase (Old Yellow Enzyme family)
MASLTRDRNLIPGPLQKEYFTQRAGAGLILTEATFIEPIGSEWSNARKGEKAILPYFSCTSAVLLMYF